MIIVNAYFDLFGSPHYDIKVVNGDGSKVEMYPDAHTFKKPRGLCPAYWKVVLRASFLQFAAMTNDSGSFKGKRWDLSKGIKHTDVLSLEDIRLILTGQCLYDILCETRTEKIGPPTARTMNRENIRNDIR